VTFTLHDVELPLYDHPYNTTALNERAVEIPAALAFLRRCYGNVGLEVGNVLGHYGCDRERRIVDLHEQGPGVENIDVFDVYGTYDWIVSVSTIEHVGWDSEPRDPDAARRALEHLRSLLTDSGRMLVTIPLGWHQRLDAAIADGVLDPVRDAVMVRQGKRWVQRTRRTHRPYGQSQPWAEAVWIGELERT
jgi:hypothetical protein